MAAPNSSPIRGSATFTTVASRNAIPEPRTVASSTHLPAGSLRLTWRAATGTLIRRPLRSGRASAHRGSSSRWARFTSEPRADRRPVSAAHDAGDHGPDEDVGERRDAPVDQDVLPRVTLRQQVAERPGQERADVEDQVHDRVVRVRLDQHEDDPQDDDAGDERGDSGDHARRRAIPGAGSHGGCTSRCTSPPRFVVDLWFSRWTRALKLLRRGRRAGGDGRLAGGAAAGRAAWRWYGLTG